MRVVRGWQADVGRWAARLVAASGPLGEDERRRLAHHASERGDGRALGRQLASREHVFYRPSQRRLQQRGGARHRVVSLERRVGKLGEA